MKSMILYTSKSGATKECAKLLAERLDCPAYDMAQLAAGEDFSSYDMIILGTGVRMGKIYKPAKAFMKKNMDLLMHKKIAIFFCNAYPETFEKAVEKNIPKELSEHAVCISSFGGKPPFTQPADQSWMNQSSMDDFMEILTASESLPIM